MTEKMQILMHVDDNRQLCRYHCLMLLMHDRIYEICEKD